MSVELFRSDALEPLPKGFPEGLVLDKHGLSQIFQKNDFITVGCF